LFKRTFILQLLVVAATILVNTAVKSFFLLKLFVPIWNARVVDSVGGISFLREFCLDGRTYNIPSKMDV